MTNISEVKNRFISLKQKFNENVQDNFGKSINEEILEPTLNNLNILVNQENLVKAKQVYIKSLLIEARTLIPLIKG
jgi:hypothetical protein